MRLAIKIFCLLYFSLTCVSQTLDTNLWIPNGPVYATEKFNNKIYIGGNFDYVGPYSGSAVKFDTTSSIPSLSFPKINGVVYAVISDNYGNWYIGGNFNKVNNLPIQNLVKVLPNGKPDPNFTPNPDNTVRSICLKYQRLYVGGNFRAICGETRYYAAAISPNTGNLLEWNPGPDSTVYCIVSSGKHIYLGGNFLSCGGTLRTRLARVDAVSGNYIGALPYIDFNYLVDGIVRTMALKNNIIFIGGEFKNVKGNKRDFVAALDINKDTILPFNPAFNGAVYDLDIWGDRVYIAGLFNKVNNTSQKHVAAFSKSSFALDTNWKPEPNKPCYAIKAVPGKVFIGGRFDQINGTNKMHIALVNAASGLLDPWDAESENDVFDIYNSNNTTVVGGRMISFNGCKRNNFAIIDLSNKIADSVSFQFNSPIYAFYKTNSELFVGGNFTKVDSVIRKKIALINLNTNSLDNLSIKMNGTVFCIIKANDSLFFGGNFDTIETSYRKNIAIYNLNSNKLCDFSPQPNGTVNSILYLNGYLYFGGYFTKVKGVSRNRIAKCNISTSFPVPNWDANADDVVYSIIQYKEHLLVSGAFNQIGSNACNYFSALDTVIGHSSSISNTINTDNTIKSMHLNNDTLTIGGYFNTINQYSADFVAQYCLASKTVLYNNLGFENAVYTAKQIGNTIIAGGIFETSNHTLHPNLALFYNTFPLNTPSYSDKKILFSIYPNPANEILIIESNLSDYKLTLTTLKGELIFEKSKLNTLKTFIDVRSLKSGLYLISISNNSGTISKKVVIEN